MIEIKNNHLKLEISETGAEIQSIWFNGEERLWNGDEKFWTGRAPVLFPICSGLKDDEYIYGGKTYSMKKHGFARKLPFEVVEKTPFSASFELKTTKETLQQYPFYFSLIIKYTLIGNKIKVNYTVKNKGRKPMYFSIGSHEAYSCPGGIENYDVIFSETETLNAYEIDGNCITDKSSTVLYESNILPMYYKYFEKDALAFKEFNSKSVILRNRLNGKAVKVEFPQADYLFLWTKPEAEYLCIEPWSGINDNVDSDKIFENKEGIIMLPADERYDREHIITFIK